MLLYLPCYFQLLSNDKGAEKLELRLWTAFEHLEPCKTSLFVLQKYLDGLNPIETQLCKSYIVFPIAVFPIAVDAFTSEEIYGLLAV